MKLELSQVCNVAGQQLRANTQVDGECVLAFGPITLPAVTRQNGSVTGNTDNVLAVTVEDSSVFNGKPSVTLVWTVTDHPYNYFVCGTPQIVDPTHILIDVSTAPNFIGTAIPDTFPTAVQVIDAAPTVIRGPSVNAIKSLTCAGSGVFWSLAFSISHDDGFGIIASYGDAFEHVSEFFSAEDLAGWTSYEGALLLLNWENAAITVSGGWVYDGARLWPANTH